MAAKMPTTAVRSDLARTMFAVLLIALLISASFWLLRPFLLASVWATTIVVATWPVMLKVQAALKSRALAVTVMTLALLLLFVVPLLLATEAILNNLGTISQWTQTLVVRIPPPPDWVAGLPLVGHKFASRWSSFVAASPEELAVRLEPIRGAAAHWLVGVFGSMGVRALNFLLTVIIAAILYAQGETARNGLIRFGRGLAGERGERMVLLAGEAIRAVALGVVVTALVQAALAGLGLFVADVPFAALLTAISLVLCVAQVGPIFVLVPAAIWLFSQGSTAWGVAMLIFAPMVGLLNNFLAPILIRKSGGASLPLLVIIAGVIGGLIAAGVIGLFVGPVVLAVSYTLLKEWVADQERAG
jgi:predicted PurR-regulated permease PerM